MTLLRLAPGCFLPVLAVSVEERATITAIPDAAGAGPAANPAVPRAGINRVLHGALMPPIVGCDFSRSVTIPP